MWSVRRVHLRGQGGGRPAGVCAGAWGELTSGQGCVFVPPTRPAFPRRVRSPGFCSLPPVGRIHVLLALSGSLSVCLSWCLCEQYWLFNFKPACQLLACRKAVGFCRVFTYDGASALEWCCDGLPAPGVRLRTYSDFLHRRSRHLRAEMVWCLLPGLCASFFLSVARAHVTLVWPRRLRGTLWPVLSFLGNGDFTITEGT